MLIGAHNGIYSISLAWSILYVMQDRFRQKHWVTYSLGSGRRFAVFTNWGRILY
jgi:hypothetical protein